MHSRADDRRVQDYFAVLPHIQIAKLALSRAVGLPLEQAFAIADALPYSDINPPTPDDALKMAYASRSERAVYLCIRQPSETV
jgi:hypothetical protein